MDEESLIYLDTYILQQDMRIRMPKSILENMNAEKGKTNFKIFYDRKQNQLVLRVAESNPITDLNKNK